MFRSVPSEEVVKLGDSVNNIDVYLFNEPRVKTTTIHFLNLMTYI